MNRTLRTLLIVALSYLVFRLILANSLTISGWFAEITRFPIITYVVMYLVAGIPIFAGTMLIHHTFRITRPLGLEGSIPAGILYPLVFALPMFIGSILFYPFNQEITVPGLLKATFFAGFFEELFFRGFLFGQIYRYTRFGFIPAILIGAVLFAAGHLYQSADPAEITGIFLTTFAGAVFFAWLYAEWRFNLWIPVFLHTFMNLSWALFHVSNNALGDVTSNIFRILTIAVAIVVTVIYKRRSGLGFEVNRSTLIWRK